MKLALTLAATLVAAGPAFAQTAAERLGLPAPDAREGMTTSVDGAEIFHAESGEGDAVVLLHGYPLSGALFERVRDTLDDGYRVITIDHRGFGNSTTEAPVEDVSTYASDAIAVLDAMGVTEAAVGGMSMGGPILFEMYRQKPELFTAAMLIDSNHLPAGPIEKGIWEGVEAQLNETGDVSSISPFLLPNMLTGETRTVTAPAQADYLTAVMSQASLDGAIGGATVLAGRPDSTETLSSMDVPVLVLVGRADPVYPVEIAQQMVDAAPDATLAIIEGASHAAVFEQPEAAAEAMLAFLGGL